MSRDRRYSLIVLAALFSTETLAAGTSEGVLSLKLRDSFTGLAIPTFEIDIGAGDAIAQARASGVGIARFSVDAGLVPIRIAAPGYKALSTQLEVVANASANPVTIWLDGENVGRSLRYPQFRQPGTVTLRGYVVDENGQPLAEARLRSGELETRSDASGHFELPFPEKITPLNLPELRDVTVELDGYKTHRISNFPIGGGDAQISIELISGTGVNFEDQTPKILRSDEEQQNAQLALQGEGHDLSRVAGGVDRAPSIIAPPSSIRVGLSCSCTDCSTVELMSLETYVRRGLKAEWISSWTQHSLRAGAVAYRSYGAFYVNHPIRPNYDICSTTCCQVNTAGTVTSTDTAVARTPGIMLQLGGEIFRAEYSAENNNNNCGDSRCSNRSCTCGNGNAGSPGANWPCVAEPWDANRTCQGHGRGMCQWGTQRAALQGQLWNWIEDHYYNNNGSPAGLRSARMTSPLDITAFSADPSVITAGDTFVIWYSVNNLSELYHDQVLLAASLYSSAVGYVSDPPNDTLIGAPPGYSDQYRWFTTPTWLPSGSYDLVVALWIDINEDGLITSADLPLVSYVMPGAIALN